MALRTLVPFDPDVVRPWDVGRGRRGALLLHGFAGTPPELRRLGDHLAARGWRCTGPALAGHGTTPEDLEKASWQDWARSAQEALDALRSECDEVVVAGQSMGGAMALHLAARNPHVRAVATLAAVVRLRLREQVLIAAAGRVVRWHVPGDAVDLWIPENAAELFSYGRQPMRALHELVRLCAAVRSELAMVRAPVLILHGRRDRTVRPENAREIERRLVCSAAVERHEFPRSGHGISVDVDREEMHERVHAWFERHTTAAVPAASAGDLTR